jgi:hypothetical protein
MAARFVEVRVETRGGTEAGGAIVCEEAGGSVKCERLDRDGAIYRCIRVKRRISDRLATREYSSHYLSPS